MNVVEAQAASEVVSALLRGAQLDSIRVYSLIVQLGFVCLRAEGTSPSEVWVSLSGTLIIEEPPSVDEESEPPRDFFSRRALALSAVYRLIGQEVIAAGISDSGVLEIQFHSKRLRAEPDDDSNLEEVWSVLSDSPETTADHRWHVSLEESGVLFARTPSSPITS